MSVEKNKKILLITYYWPPSGGPGVQRPLKFAKYLSKFGHDVTVYTPSNGEYPVMDHSLLQDIPKEVNVIKRKIFEPYQLFKFLSGRKKAINPNVLNEKKENGFLHYLSIWIRGNVFIPDARMFWIKPSIRFLCKEVLRQDNFDVVITTGPPHSLHLIGKGIKEKTGIQWIADFRDPWTEIDYFDQLKLTSFSKKKHQKLETSVLQNADACVTVTESWKEDLERLGANKAYCIYNGYDEEDFAPYRHITPGEDKFIITHIGQIFKNRNYDVFWKAMKELVSSNDEISNKLHIRFIGKIDGSVHTSVKKYGLENYFEHIPSVPHKEVPKYLFQSHLLYLPLDDAKGAEKKIPGKVFEYMASTRPILAIIIGESELARMLNKNNSNYIFSNRYSISELLFFLKNKLTSNKLVETGVSYESYARENQTKLIEVTFC